MKWLFLFVISVIYQECSEGLKICVCVLHLNNRNLTGVSSTLALHLMNMYYIFFSCLIFFRMAQNREIYWQVGKSVLECNRYMWEKKLANDIVFEVGASEGHVEKISAHKYVLISRSPVFEAMFNGGLSKNTGSVVKITDVDPHAFKEALK